MDIIKSARNKKDDLRLQKLARQQLRVHRALEDLQDLFHILGISCTCQLVRLKDILRGEKKYQKDGHLVDGNGIWLFTFLITWGSNLWEVKKLDMNNLLRFR